MIYLFHSNGLATPITQIEKILLKSSSISIVFFSLELISPDAIKVDLVLEKALKLLN